MNGFARRILAFVLVMALVVAGMPLAHAMPCESLAQVEQVHTHHATAHDVPDHGDQHRLKHAGQAPMSQDDPQHTAAPCKCLNCNTCLASFVAPLDFTVTLERVGFAVSYDPVATGDLGAFVFIDPGIPIFAM